ncbi:MAG: 30S ribosomal protein S6 [Mycoplasmatales bacterium]
MRKYEVGFIIKPNVDESLVQATVEKLKEIYTSAGSNILDEFDMGTKELAYEIEKNKTGYYYFLNVEAVSETNKEFERICRISEDVLRFMVINIDKVEGSTLDMLREAK